MKRLVIITGLLAASSCVSAYNCNHLVTKVVNESGRECKLKTMQTYFGYPLTKPMDTIAAGVTTPEFYVEQNSDGILIQMDYRCEGKVVIMSTYQEHCGFSAGSLSSYSYEGNDLTVDAKNVPGSYWSSTPGSVTWTIHDN